MVEGSKPTETGGTVSSQQTQSLAEAFVKSSQHFLDRLQILKEALEPHIDEYYTSDKPSSGGLYEFPRCKDTLRKSYCWKPPEDFNYSGLACSASETYEAWYVARSLNDEVTAFNGATLLPLVRLFEKIGRGSGMPAGSAAYADIPSLFLTFKAEVVRLEVHLSLKRFVGTIQAPESHSHHASTLPVVEQQDASTSIAEKKAAAKSTIKPLPFGLELCDVQQSLKRVGRKKTVTIRNEEYWRLMQALMEAAPNAIPESKLKHLFSSKSDRDNAPKKLREIIHDFGLTVKNWTLIELDT